jgi:hypothetical protein
MKETFATGLQPTASYHRKTRRSNNDTANDKRISNHGVWRARRDGGSGLDPSPNTGVNSYAPTAFAPQGAYSQTATGQPVTYDANGRAMYGQPAAYAAPGYAQPIAANTNCVEPAMTYSNAAYVPAPAYRSPLCAHVS